jgi:hypothetical protein
MQNNYFYNNIVLIIKGTETYQSKSASVPFCKPVVSMVYAKVHIIYGAVYMSGITKTSLIVF